MDQPVLKQAAGCKTGEALNQAITYVTRFAKTILNSTLIKLQYKPSKNTLNYFILPQCL